MRLLGLGWREVQALPYSEFTRLVKCATMLEARERMVNIRVSNYVHLKEPDKKSFHRELAEQASAFIEKKILDYRDVLNNVAKALHGRR